MNHGSRTARPRRGRRRPAGPPMRRHGNGLFRHAVLERLEPRLLLSADVGQPIDLGQPALFTVNQGPWRDAAIRYQYDADGAQVMHTTSGPRITLKTRPGSTPGAAEPSTPWDPARDSLTVALQFDDAVNVAPHGLDQAPTQDGSPAGESTAQPLDARAYGSVVYPDVYPGIDALTWAYDDSLKYEFHVAPGVDYRQIQLSYLGIEGLSIDTDGALRIETAAGELIDDAPFTYQDVGAARVEVPSRFVLLDDNSYTFQLGVHDTTLPLVIDPELEWGRFVGGSDADFGKDIATDAVGDAYAAGWTQSADDFPIIDPFGVSSDVLVGATVAKITHNGELDWSVRLGGNGVDFANAITVDIQGNVIVGGKTGSPDFPTFGAWDSSFSGSSDGWVAKFSAAGDLLWSTYLGGESGENLIDVATDFAGNIVVAGTTDSKLWRFRPADPLEPITGQSDIFIVKLNANGDVLWGHKFGGSALEQTNSVATNSLGEIFISGYLDGPTDFPTGSLAPSFAGERDAFLTKFTSEGGLEWSTFLGGTRRDLGFIAVDSQDNILMAGNTSSRDLPTPGGFDATYNAEQTCSNCADNMDGFVASFNSAGTLRWASYLGEFPKPIGYTAKKLVSRIAVDSDDNLVVGGRILAQFEKNRIDPAVDIHRIFVAKVLPQGNAVAQSYFGDDSNSTTDTLVASIAVDRADNIFATGTMQSVDGDFFGGQLIGGPLSGIRDGFVAKFGADTLPPPPATSHELFEFLAKDVAYRDWAEGDTVDLQQLGLDHAIVFTVDRAPQDSVAG